MLGQKDIQYLCGTGLGQKDLQYLCDPPLVNEGWLDQDVSEVKGMQHIKRRLVKKRMGEIKKIPVKMIYSKKVKENSEVMCGKTTMNTNDTNLQRKENHLFLT